jgi:hypothetical protein
MNPEVRLDARKDLVELIRRPPIERPTEQLGIEVRHRLRVGAREIDEDHGVKAINHGHNVGA